MDEDPSATVNVTEIVDDGTPSEEITGTEGVDYLCIYEDSEIVAFEEESKGLWRKFIDKVKAIWRKIVEFVKSTVDRIMAFFGDKGKWYKQNRDKVEKNWDAAMKKNPEISVSVVFSHDSGSKLQQMLDKIIANISEIKTTDFLGNIHDTTNRERGQGAKSRIEETFKAPDSGNPLANIDSGDSATEFFKNTVKAIYDAKSPAANGDKDKKFKLSEIGVDNISILDGFLNENLPRMWKKAMAAIDGSARKVMGELDKIAHQVADDKKASKEALKKAQDKGITTQKSYQMAHRVYTLGAVTAFKAAKAIASGGSSSDDSDD